MAQALEPLAGLPVGPERAGERDQLERRLGGRGGDRGRRLGGFQRTRELLGPRGRRRDRVAIPGLEREPVEQRGQVEHRHAQHRQRHREAVSPPVLGQQRERPPGERLVVQPEVPVQWMIEIQLAEHEKRPDRIVARAPAACSSAPTRDPLTVPSAPSSIAPSDQRARVRLDLEAQPGRVASQPQQPGRIVDEAAVVQHAQPARLEILERARHRIHLAGRSAA